MIKKTLYFGNPAYLFLRNKQLVIKYPDASGENAKDNARSNKHSIPVEDIGVVIIDNEQISVSHGLLAELLDNNSAVITTNSSHMPSGMFLPLNSHTQQSERFRDQITASLPLKKQLWQQTVSAKILNQAALLNKKEIPSENMKKWAREVRSGDPENLEGRAAVYYWRKVFPEYPDFERERYGLAPNNLLNYGYAILRAVVARSLAGSGLLPTLGIHHSNKYNAYCLADDMMEPYRPYVDMIVSGIVSSEVDYEELTPDLKKILLGIPVMDTIIEGKGSPLMIAVQRTTASLSECFSGRSKTLLYPELS
ncbi:MAG: type II CRISPR-associated endonuclease Cas1 [Ignavibacteriaceae bacterium]|nr:type II CRISPR-associated endonuclease Cas1 [Ignavibacteriaceae bacterium]